MARFGVAAIQPAQWLAKNHFTTARARALFAGLAGHSFLSFDQVLSSAIALILGASAHTVGWPIPRGGARAIPHALVSYLEALGGTVHTAQRIDAKSLGEMKGTLTLCDTAPRQLAMLAGDRLTPAYRRAFERFEHGPGAFKVDYALSEPVPWRAADCRRAITVHLGGTFEEIAESERAVVHGHAAERPFILAAQPTLFDPARAPHGKHVLWAYCHVPNGSAADMTERIEAQIERFAPGFRDCVLARHIASPARLESMDANLVGGDVGGGTMNVRQLLFRPTLHSYATGTPDLYLCSASTPPGGGVHGMCGYHSARLALRRMK
jgi:phytoene dehydrogenase-like protein